MGRSGFHRGKRGAEAIDSRRDTRKGEAHRTVPQRGKTLKPGGRGMPTDMGFWNGGMEENSAPMVK